MGLCVSVYLTFQMEHNFPTLLPTLSPIPSSSQSCFHFLMALLLSGVTFPLKNLFYELNYQSRMKKLIHLPSSLLTAFSHYRLCVKIKLLTCWNKVVNMYWLRAYFPIRLWASWRQRTDSIMFVFPGTW